MLAVQRGLMSLSPAAWVKSGLVRCCGLLTGSVNGSHSVHWSCILHCSARLPRAGASKSRAKRPLSGPTTAVSQTPPREPQWSVLRELMAMWVQGSVWFLDMECWLGHHAL